MKDSRELVREITAQLRSRQPLPPLCPQATWNRELSGRIASADLAAPVASALLLWNDDLDASHTLSQGLPDRFGSWLHGAMHRREGDFSNSKYWFRKVGAHAGFAQMSKRAGGVLAEAGGKSAPALAVLVQRWDPFAFADLCAAATGPDAATAPLLQAFQAAELELLTELAAERLPG